MGILNVTPDSFFDGGRYTQTDALLTQAQQMITQGAALLDIGAYSSRPQADNISPAEELKRLLPAIEALRATYPEVLLSVDTFRASVAEEALKAGAAIINDISGGQADEQMYAVLARYQVPYVLMHMRGTPQTMQQLTQYEHLLPELVAYFQKKIAILQHKGVSEIIVDPGFGFAKTISQNFALLKHLATLHILEKPLLVGISRKSMIYKTLGHPDASTALNGTTALHSLALLGGAHILRVHDVQAAKEVVTLMESFWEAS
jgi:dihydropteroate synthase